MPTTRRFGGDNDQSRTMSYFLPVLPGAHASSQADEFKRPAMEDKRPQHGRIQLAWTITVGLVIAAACAAGSVAVVRAVDRQDDRDVRKAFVSRSTETADRFEERLYLYTTYQQHMAEILSEFGEIDPDEFAVICDSVATQFAEQAALRNIIAYTGVSHERREAYEDNLRGYWASGTPEQVQEGLARGLFIKDSFTNADTGRVTSERASNRSMYYSYSANCFIADNDPPAKPIFFADVWKFPTRRNKMFLATQADRVAVTEPVLLIFQQVFGYVAYAPVRPAQDQQTPWLSAADRAVGWADGVVLGLYILDGIVEELAAELQADEFVVMLEDVTTEPEFVLGGQSAVDALRDMNDATAAENFTAAQWHLHQRVIGQHDGRDLYLIDAMYPCDKGVVKSSKSIADRLPGRSQKDVCIGSHTLGFGKGHFLAAGRSTKGRVDTTPVPLTVAEALEAKQAAKAVDTDDAVLVSAFRVSFANRQLNLVIVGTAKFRQIHQSKAEIVAMVACTVMSCLITAFVIVLLVVGRARTRTALERRRTLIADASRLANEQATKYAVHELETPLLAMTERSRATQEALDDVTASLYEYIAARTGVDVASVHHVLMTSEPFNVLEQLLVIGGGDDLASEDRLELQALLTDISDDLRCAHDDISQVHLSCQAMSRLISDLLDLASLRKGEFKLNAERTSLRRMMAALVNQHRGMAVVPLRLEPLPRALPTYIMIDPLRFAQVLSNGLTNACKLTREGSIYVAVRVEWPDELERAKEDSFEVITADLPESEADQARANRAQQPLSGSFTSFREACFSDIPNGRLETDLQTLETSAGRRLSLNSLNHQPPTGATQPASDCDGVRTTAPPPGPMIVITVSDTGPGLEGVDTEKLFQPFEQGPAQAGNGNGDCGEGEQRGTGLGLPLARRMARAMGGSVCLKNRQTCTGGLYIITLPLVVPSTAQGGGRFGWN